MEKRIAELERILQDLDFCTLCEATTCPCNAYQEVIAELAQLRVDQFFAKFFPENGNCYVTGLEV